MSKRQNPCCRSSSLREWKREGRRWRSLCPLQALTSMHIMYSLQLFLNRRRCRGVLPKQPAKNSQGTVGVPSTLHKAVSPKTCVVPHLSGEHWSILCQLPSFSSASSSASGPSSGWQRSPPDLDRDFSDWQCSFWPATSQCEKRAILVRFTDWSQGRSIAWQRVRSPFLSTFFPHDRSESLGYNI